MKSDDIIIGIDLGTTNSEVAVYHKDKIEIVSENNRAMVPSVVSLSPDGQLLVGDEARNSFALYPERTVKSIKRKMGSSEKVKLAEKEFTPQELSAIILRELKARAERFINCPVSKAVVTVPAYFSDAQRQATRDAGTIAGLEVVRILNEPTAACLAYDNSLDEGVKTMMAFDLGGGTFDVSVVHLEGDLVEVIASHGDNHLGGDDFDDLIFNHILKQVNERQENSVSLNAISLNRLKRAAEVAKIHLTNEYYCKVIEDNLETINGGKEHLEMELSRDEFESMIESLLSKTLASVHQAMADAGKKPKDIDGIILVGGSSRMPIVSEYLERELGKVPRQDVHPDLAVTYGAGVMAARMMGSSDQRILVDITPYTFGTSAMGRVNDDYVPYKFVPIIKAGTPLPVTRSEQFFTMVDGQLQCDCTIFQGESDDARKNIMVGNFMVEGLSRKAPAGSPIVVHMSLDLDGILRVTAEEKQTGLSKNVVIENTLDKLSDEALAKSQREIDKMFRADGQEPVSFEDKHTHSDAIDVPSGNSAQSRKCLDLLKRIEKSMEKMDNVDQEDAEKLSKELKEAMADNNVDEMKRIAEELEDLIFYVETGQ